MTNRFDTSFAWCYVTSAAYNGKLMFYRAKDTHSRADYHMAVRCMRELESVLDSRFHTYAELENGFFFNVTNKMDKIETVAKIMGR